jgi:hypothetical protein
LSICFYGVIKNFVDEISEFVNRDSEVVAFYSYYWVYIKVLYADGLYFDKGGCLFMGNEYENKSLGPINPDLILKHEQKVLKILNTLNSTLLQKSSDEILTKFEGISYALPKIN